QLGYVAAARAYGVILSIDGRGVVTLHFPVGSTGAGELEREGESLLPFAYELDDAPGFERFFFVTGPEPFAVDSVLEAAERLAADPEQARQAPLILPGELEQVSMMLKKTAAVR
ncbi:MAG: hypothetical protein JW820_20865, partial [Spirochaetales bacterium]|nr:hypothetical protein [Spirochaetales bacterium]